jgi:thiamine biosynthesis protein ThiI
MPLGSQGKVIGLLSAKPYSILAHWLIMKRGCSLDLLYIDKGLGEKGLGEGLGTNKERAYENAEKLKAWNPNMKIYEIESKNKGNENYTKEDYAQACEFAFKKGALALVSGETLEDLLQKGRFEDNVSEMPIFYPLVGFSDEEIKKRMKDAELS